MALRQRLDEDLKSAMRAGDTLRRDTVRLLLSSLRNAEIENRGPLDQAGEDRVVMKEVKQRKDSIEEYRKAGREELALREEAEMEILTAYQPEQLSDSDIRALVERSITRTGAAGIGDIGKVMKDVMPDVAGRADGTAINAVVRELLKN